MTLLGGERRMFNVSQIDWLGRYGFDDANCRVHCAGAEFILAGSYASVSARIQAEFHEIARAVGAGWQAAQQSEDVRQHREANRATVQHLIDAAQRMVAERRVPATGAGLVDRVVAALPEDAVVTDAVLRAYNAAAPPAGFRQIEFREPESSDPVPPSGT